MLTWPWAHAEPLLHEVPHARRKGQRRGAVLHHARLRRALHVGLALMRPHVRVQLALMRAVHALPVLPALLLVHGRRPEDGLPRPLALRRRRLLAPIHSLEAHPLTLHSIVTIQSAPHT